MHLPLSPSRAIWWTFRNAASAMGKLPARVVRYESSQLDVSYKVQSSNFSLSWQHAEAWTLNFRQGAGEKMNRRRQKTVITVETFQRTTVRLRREAKVAWCEQCEAETAMLAPDEAAAHLQTTAREIFRLTEAGQIHFLETESGALLICRNSCQNHLR